MRWRYLGSDLTEGPYVHIGLDIGGTRTKFVGVRYAGGIISVVSSGVFPTAGTGPQEIISRSIGESADRILRARNARTASVSMCVPGTVMRANGVAIDVPNLPGDWREVPVAQIASEVVGTHVNVVNDARAFTLGEALLGGGRRYRTVFGVTLGTGIGGGLAIDGAVNVSFRGVTGGDIGHQVIDLTGERRCACGNHGCAETYVSTDVLLAESGLRSIADVFASARRGGVAARNAVRNYISYVGLLLANVHTIVCPDVYVVGGGVSAADAELVPSIERELRERVFFDMPEHISVRRGELGELGGAIGAILWSLQDGRMNEVMIERKEMAVRLD